jgi:hypothetical protein
MSRRGRCDSIKRFPIEWFPNPRETVAASKNAYTRPGNRPTTFLLSIPISTRAIVSHKGPVSIRPHAGARGDWHRSEAYPLRGRPQNTTQAVPARLSMVASSQTRSQRASKQARPETGCRRGRPPGSRNKSTVARLALEASQQASSRSGPHLSATLTVDQLLLELDELQEFVPVDERRNLAFGGEGVDGSCLTATRRFFPL